MDGKELVHSGEVSREQFEAAMEYWRTFADAFRRQFEVLAQALAAWYENNRDFFGRLVDALEAEGQDAYRVNWRRDARMRMWARRAHNRRMVPGGVRIFRSRRLTAGLIMFGTRRG